MLRRFLFWMPISISCILSIGTTLSASKRSNLQYSASVLHFPWVAQKLKSDTVLILDWLDLDNDSSAYTVLWKIGVREFPVLGELVEMINHQHETQLRENPVNAYQIPHALPFLAKYLLKSYPELLSADKVTYAFLPARLVTSVANRKDGVNHDRIVLMPVNRIFKCKHLSESTRTLISSLYRYQSIIRLPFGTSRRFI